MDEVKSRRAKWRWIVCLAVVAAFLGVGPTWADPEVPVIEAAKAGDVARLKRIIKSQPWSLSVTDESLVATPLHWAVINGHQEAALWLLSVGAPVKARDKTGFTALHYAAYVGLPAVAVALIDKGADVNAVSDWIGVTPLHVAALKNRLLVATVLLSRGAKVAVRDRRGRTPRQYARQRGHWMFVALLSRNK